MTRTVRADTSGPGNNYLAETIQIRSVAAEKAVDIFTLEQTNGPATIRLRWHDPNHLEVAYANGKIAFQAVRVGPLRIDTVAAAR